ncbi:MAG: hypothetical protein COX65_04610 [Elusimicrobia bacterium CG_4_10_14_0_2_um_filter_56_8]|nr:MAG: hypothetical protein COX65_04610 [Elusimicrobia bacterium CG_4_10_14_0_2_um_filter_56_8]
MRSGLAGKEQYNYFMDIEKLTPQELNDLKIRVDRRLREVTGADSRSFAERLSAKDIVELVVFAVKGKAIRCRTLDTGEPLTFRPASGVRSEAEGYILTVRPGKAWSYGRTTYLSGQVLNMRLDIPALKLIPLKLEDEEVWDPREEYWGEEGEPVMDCFKPIIAAGPRPSFEMEQILPGFDPEDPDSDPIGQAVDFYETGEIEKSYTVLQQCLEADWRVLDAHTHLGNWVFGEEPGKWQAEQARRHYAAGVAIGELALGPDFKGVLPWGRINNRPFLRCLHGLGLCFWALGDLQAAGKIFKRMLWLNPGDNQGARFCLLETSAGTSYAESEL